MSGSKLSVAAVAMLATLGCQGGDPGPMSGRQALSARDIGDLFFWKPRTLAFTRDAADSSQPEPQDFLVWPLDEPTPTVALAGIDWTYPDTWPVWRAGDLLVTGSRFERVFDYGSRQAVNLLQDLPARPGGTGAADVPFRTLLATTAICSDGHELASLLRGTPEAIAVGRPNDLHVYALPDGASVGAVLYLGNDLALLVKQATGNGDVVGIQRMDTSSGALTPLVAPTPAEEWVGITGFCDDVQQAPGACGFFETFGCDLDAPACPDGRQMPCLIVYAKADGVSPKSAHVFDVGAGTTTKLDGVDVDRFFGDARHHLLAWGSRTNNFTKYWNVCSDTRGECPFSNQAVAWRPDGGAFASYGPGDSLRVVNIAGGSCDEPVPGTAYSVRQAQYAPAGDRLWWVSANDAAETAETLWLADGNAQSPVALVTGPTLGAGFTLDGAGLYVVHQGESSSALGWIDLAAPSPSEQILSANRGDTGFLDSRRALFVDHFNLQDGNGELVLVELATGARQSLARAVTAVAVAPNPETDETDVAYTVRGRAASSRDGLWLTTLPP